MPRRCASLILLLLCSGVCLPILAAEDGDAGRDKVERRASGIFPAGKAAGTGKAFRLFILSGQSNMAGLPDQLTFIPALVAAFPDDEILIVKDAQSGQPIRRWHKDWQPAEGWTGRNGRDKPGNNDLYQRLMERVTEGVGERKPDSIVFVWMQGEADAKAGQAKQYGESLAGLIAQVRNDLGRKDVAAVVGRLSDCESGTPDWDTVRAAQVAVATADPLVEWVDTDDLNGEINGLHYTGDGYETLGTRFAEKAIALIKAKKP